MTDFFFCNDTATTEIYTLSLHDALPIFAFVVIAAAASVCSSCGGASAAPAAACAPVDRKSTRLNSSHTVISYAVFCLKKKSLTAAKLCTCQCSLRRARGRAACFGTVGNM